MRSEALFIAGLVALLAGCEALMFGNVIVGCAMRPDPEILPKALPAATVEVPYRMRVDVINASTPLSKLLVPPDKPLPAGLELTHREREKQGVIEEVPITAGSYDVLVYGSTYGTQCAGQSAERLYRLDVQN
ncbi:hypothetical protein HNE05_20150 [Aquipseudomonas campi]|uniref:Lipoprotein n=1 Tax=Aquipseudomonas campi TaxID=2731681 RepID=A0A6M8FH31_9GAMM|nr:hypothetical protein [Pseudomonas campi]QKE65573.1 hypothetical protein HNE05_20150 [Pseudomonas campi]